MPVIIAYLTVVLIWSTTPLGIVWSSETVNPIMAVMLRSVIAAPVALLLLKIFKIPMRWDAQAVKIYCYSCLNIYLGMLLTYLAARDISSGLISLIYGLAPMITGILAQKILSEPAFSRAKQLALLIAFSGLLIVCYDNITVADNNWHSLLVLIAGMLAFSLSGVMVKSVHLALPPLVTTAGALTLSIPLFFVSWYFLDGTLPTNDWSPRSIAAIIYLGTIGSILGFIAYYYVLQRLDAATVGLVTLVTPVLALILGATFNSEQITTSVLTGAGCIIVGMAIYLFGDKLGLKIRKLANR